MGKQLGTDTGAELPESEFQVNSSSLVGSTYSLYQFRTEAVNQSRCCPTGDTWMEIFWGRGGTTGIWWAGPRDTAQYPTAHRLAPTIEDGPAPDVNSAEFENLRSRSFYFFLHQLGFRAYPTIR